MSTLSGQASKGEKTTKSKFQSLDINNLYRVSRGESTEKQQTKSSSVFIKHGMQSLGKVPSARRAPANLPSLKSEHSETGAAVPLVPPGGPGWGKQESGNGGPASGAAAPTTPASASAPQSGAAPTAAPAASAQPTPAVNQPPTATAPAPLQKSSSLTGATPATSDKLWSSITSGSDPLHPPPYQSPQFQHEFPSLSAGDGGPTRTGSDAQYTSGLSLRPQTEGSWTQGGQRGGAGSDMMPRPPGSGPPAAPQQLAGQAGPQQQPLPPQFRTVLPPFMFKGNFPPPQSTGSNATSTTAGGAHHAAPNAQPPVNGGRNRPIDNRQPRSADNAEELPLRPIIKEEDLSRMDELGGDMGWAIQDEIDYNQKLAFSDDEGEPAPPKRHHQQQPPQQQSHQHQQQHHHHESGSNKPQISIHTRDRGELERSDSHSSDGRQQPQQWGANRSRGRSSEEEDMRMQRRTQQEVDLAVQRAKQRKEEEEKRFNEATKQGAAKKLLELEEKIQKRDRVTEGSGTINPAAVPPKPINHNTPIPIPEFQKDKEQQNDPNDDKHQANNFRQMALIEGKNFPRKHNSNSKSERDSRPNEQPGHFSRHFQNDLPPRFMKHQRNNQGGQQSQQQQQPQQGQGQYNQFDNRWQGAPNSKTGPGAVANANRNSVRDSPDRPVEEDRRDYKRQGSEDGYRQSEDEHHYKDQKTQSSRGSRHSESRDYMSTWSEPAYESYEDKRKEGRVVPGPITKERIEADDLRSEKRGLTQLKRGQPEKKPESTKLDEDAKKEAVSTAWADALPTAEDQIDTSKYLGDDKAKTDAKHFGQQDSNKRQNRPSSNRSWGGDYQRGQAWSSKRPVQTSRGGHKYHNTDSEGSDSERTKTKQEKDEKNRSNYIPRGEPSRIGRGGGTFGRNSRLSGLSKKIDGYGPPPKSPFGHHDDQNKDRKISSDEASTEVLSSDDKIKANQQALSAGIIGSRKEEDKNKPRKDGRRGKSRSKKDDEVYDTNSELSDEKDGKLGAKKAPGKKPVPVRPASNPGAGGGRRNAPPPPRMGGDKRFGDGPILRQNSSGSLKKDEKTEQNQNVLCTAIADITLKGDLPEDKEELSVNGGDSEGFQEVKSKKTVKERQKSAEDKSKAPAKPEPGNKDVKDVRCKPAPKLMQPIQNIPPLMATPVNPPQVLPKKDFERPRQNKLAPRFAKQKLQKAQMQQQHMHDVNDLNKVNQNLNVYGMKDGGVPVSSWDKPLPCIMGGVPVDISGKSLDCAQVTTQGTSPNTDKMLSKDKTVLDGTTPPVNTIIFENTNFKSAPGSRNSRNDPKPRKLDDALDSGTIGNFNKPLTELIGKDKSDSIQLPMSFKDDNADMKLDFFDSDLSHLTDEKTSKNLMGRTMAAGNNSTMCTADSLNIKIASVKKVWETSEHVGQDEASSFGNSFVGDGNLDPNVFNKSTDQQDEGHEVYNQSPNQSASTTTNVCKVKPTQQVSGGGQTVLSTNHQPQLAMATQSLMGNPLSPPPMQHVPGTGVGLGQAPAYGAANQHMSYPPAGLGGSGQFGMSAIPSPPTVSVLYNQQANAGLYGTFPIDQASVLGGQGRSQYSQYPYAAFGQTASSPYSTQSVYLPTAPPPPPPQAAQAPDMYQNLRLTQQLNNASSVLITSTSNTLMTPSVKPNSQQMSAIGTKAGGVGQAYQQQSQQGMFMYEQPLQANFMSGIQRPGGPVQNNVVTALPPSSSFYSGSTGGQTGFFQQPTNSSLQSAPPLGQHQAGGYALQGFATHNQTHTSPGFNSHFLSTPMQMAALTQQYRSGFLKNVPGQQMGDQSGRPQQLKSPSSQEALSSVFSGSQIPSPKSRQTCKHPPPQSSPTAQPKYLYQNMGNQQNNVPRYPTPIQRPVNFQQNLGGAGQNNVNPKHRQNNVGNKAPNRQFYGGQNHSLTSQSDKADDAKLGDSNGLTGAGGATSTAAPTKPASTPQAPPNKEDGPKEEPAALKD